MRSFDKEEKIIVQKLRELPKIKDETDKEILYKRISQNINKPVKKPKRQIKYVPILGSAFALILLAFLIPSFLNTDSKENTLHDSERSAENYSLQMDEAPPEESETEEQPSTQQQSEPDKDTNIEEDNETEEADDEIESSESENSEEIENDDGIESLEENRDFDETLVVSSVAADEVIVHAALADNQSQYVIPLSFVVSADEDLDTVYNNLSNLLSENDWGLTPFPLEDVEFDVDLDNKSVDIELLEDFELEEGGSNSAVFPKILSAMFNPYGIDKVVFHPEDEESFELGALGSETELEIKKEPVANYKIYQATSDSKKFLVPIPQENLSLEESFEELKKGLEDFHVYATIPEEAEFTISQENEFLRVEFLEPLTTMENEAIMLMIESMLMTSKEHGFTQVQFENTGIESIGPYQVSESIKVPEAINLIR